MLLRPSSLLVRILTTIYPSQEGETTVEQDIKSGRDVSNRRGVCLRYLDCVLSLRSARYMQDLAITNHERVAPIENVEYCVRKSKGDFISGGASGIVERLPSGDVVKSPWPGAQAAESRRDLTTESLLYKRLGCHSRLVKVIAWDPEECALTMEYMPNGCLKDYLLAHNDKISMTQRLRWVREAAEGLQLLHSAKAIHCDVEPKNFLLDADLGLKIADFSGSSLEGSQASACAGTRFLPPDFDWCSAPTVQNDLYGLGSTIYSIMTGRYPFQEVGSDEVEKLYKAHNFPDVTRILCGEIIERCWRFEVVSAQEICNFVRDMEIKQLCKIDIHSASPMLTSDGEEPACSVAISKSPNHIPKP